MGSDDGMERSRWPLDVRSFSDCSSVLLVFFKPILLFSRVFYGVGGTLMPAYGRSELILGNTFPAIVFFSFGSWLFIQTYCTVLTYFS
jgi:hypothetical protein